MTLAETREAPSREKGQVWRPVQYLGSKLRSLDSIAGVVDAVCASTGTVWDPFTGSSVVAQAIAQTRRRVIAHDTQQAAATFAAALLGVGRADCDEPPASVADQLWDRLLQAVEDVKLDQSFWGPWLADEDDAIATADAQRILDVSEAMPQRWKEGAPSPPEEFRGPGFASTFAGSYFGLRQSLRLDALRVAVQHLEQSCHLGDWERNVLLTGLSHAASRAVFSAGKHFAQPLRAANGNLAFAHERLIQDRTVDIDEGVRVGIARTIASGRAGGEGHDAGRREVLEAEASDLIAQDVQCVYADPPYTAQQYSRFYHVLETLVKGVSEPLQVWRGGVTRGLYPRDRYLSPFCSATAAPSAFQGFISTVADSGAALILSYSASRSESGNARMVRLDDLLSWMTDAYGRSNIEVLQLDHAYRQFNSADLATADRDEPEYLVTAVRE